MEKELKREIGSNGAEHALDSRDKKIVPDLRGNDGAAAKNAEAEAMDESGRLAKKYAYEHGLAWHDCDDVLGAFGTEVPTEYPYEKVFAKEFAEGITAIGGSA